MRRESDRKFDLCVIGAGSGGLSVASAAAQLGLNTVLVERAEMGGDCLNTGCVPSKALLYAAKVAQNFRQPGTVGIAAHEPEIDFSAVKDHVLNVIAAIAPHDSQKRFEKLGVTVVRGAASFSDAHTIEVGAQSITARYFVIATGSRAALPTIAGLEPDRVLTNENLFSLRHKPDHLVIVGGGPVGTEMAQAHRRLGCKVTILDSGRILSKDDPEFVDILRRQFQEEGIELYEDARIEKIVHHIKGSSIHVFYNGAAKIVTGSHILIAAGRAPNVEGLGLERAAVDVNEAGIKTDARLRTSQKHIFAAGDVAGGPQFTHIAGHHAGIIIRNLAFKLPAKVNYKALPWVTYTEPELANVGLTQGAAERQHGKDGCRSISYSFADNDRAQAELHTDGKIKVTALRNGRILGATVIGPHAGELIGFWGLAITKGLKLKDITAMIAPYPTFGEASRQVSAAWFTSMLFGVRTRFLVQLLQKLPF